MSGGLRWQDLYNLAAEALPLAAKRVLLKRRGLASSFLRVAGTEYLVTELDGICYVLQPEGGIVPWK